MTRARLVGCIALVTSIAACRYPNPAGEGADARHGDAARADAPGADAPVDAPPADGPFAGTALLLAAAPAIASAGDFVTFEGTFAPSGTFPVTFPGGQVASAVMLGSHRARVRVPPGATAGAIVAAASFPSSVPFRRAAAALSLGALAPEPQTGAARLASTLTTARRGHAAVVVGGRLHVLGGAAGDGQVIASDEWARIDGDGGLGAFVSVPGLVRPRQGHAVVTVGTFAYVLGGVGADGMALASVEVAPIGPGVLGPFIELASASLSVPRAHPSAAVIGSWLYVFGGNGGASETVERAAIGPDGSLGPFVMVPGLTVPGEVACGAMVVGDVVVMLAPATALGTSVLHAAIAPDGELSPFVVDPPAESRRVDARCVSVGRSIYVFGGQTSGPAIEVIQVAQADVGTIVGAATPVPGGVLLDHAGGGATATLVGDQIYLTGGGPMATTRVSRIALNQGAALGAMQVDPAAPLQQARFGAVTVVLGDGAYLIGGYDASQQPLATIERLPITEDGALGPGVVVPTTLAVARAGHAVAVLGDNVYVLGGWNGSGPVATVERASISPDGTLGPFAVVPGVSLTGPRMDHASVVSGGYLYVVGGDDGMVVLPTARAPIAADGTLGAFALVPGAPAQAAIGARPLVTSSAVYLIAGSDASAPSTTIAVASVAPDGAVGPFTVAAPGLIQARAAAATFALGGRLLVLGGFNGTAVIDTMEAASLDAAGVLSAFSPNYLSLGPGIAASSAVLLGNHAYLLGGGGPMFPPGTVAQSTLE